MFCGKHSLSINVKMFCAATLSINGKMFGATMRTDV